MNDNIVEEILEKTDIVSVIGSEVDLVSKGSNYLGLCPFHQDTTPSFTVSPEKKIYKCFSCGEGGNVITFTQKYFNLTFQEALAKLAKLNGITYNVRTTKKLKEHELLGYAKDFYNSTLTLSVVAEDARDYLNTREIDDELIDKFNLGYAPSGDANFLSYYNEKLSDDFTLSTLNETGLVNNSQDFFYNRLMVPISDENDNVVGFSGRIIGSGNPKYLNSKTTNIFNKSRILYNFNNAKRSLDNQEIIIVEGFFDVIAFSKIGIENVVATMGTSFSNQHISLLKKYHVDKIILALDRDSPGKKATLEVGNNLLNNGFSKVDVLSFNNAKDVDEYLTTNEQVSIMDSKTNFFQFKMNYLSTIYNLNDIEQKAKYITDVLVGINRIELNLQNIILDELSNITGLTTDRLQLNIKSQTSSAFNSEKVVTRENRNTNKLPTDDDVVIKYCMRSKQNCHRIAEYVSTGKYKFNNHVSLFNELCKFYEINEDFDIIDFVDAAEIDFFAEANKINKDDNLDIEKIELILGKTVNNKKLTGLNIIRKTNR